MPSRDTFLPGCTGLQAGLQLWFSGCQEGEQGLILQQAQLTALQAEDMYSSSSDGSSSWPELLMLLAVDPMNDCADAIVPDMLQHVCNSSALPTSILHDVQHSA